MKQLLVKYLPIALLFFCAFPFCVLAQEKTLDYYDNDTHKSEILPDARDSFKRGNYDRVVTLCDWYSWIVGDDKAQSLREKAERCANLTKEMNGLQSEGDLNEAKLKASAILSLNPDDVAAKSILLIEEPTPIPSDTLVVMHPLGPNEQDTLIPNEGDSKETIEEQGPEVVSPPKEDEDSVLGIVESPIPGPPYEPHTRFVIKGGVSVLDLKQVSQTIAPGGSVGLFDIGGSRIGGEIGGFFCPGLSAVSASLAGIDAALVLRAAKGVYPKLGVGFFSCKSTDSSDATTKGMCAGASLTFLMGAHFCLEIGAKYYPVVRISGFETVTTAGVSYEFPAQKEMLSGGVAPMVAIGWVF